jgi:group II intron reverse transcriptase/maturase
MLLLEAQKYLEIVRKRGEAQSELRRVYYNIATNKELFLKAYCNLYANDGAMTPGIDISDTVDGMSTERIEAIMKKLRNREYQWIPVRRTYIEKKNSQKKRPLGMPGFNDKLVQEVIRMVLETYYEPQFRKSSHGFRPHKGCHTAIDTIATWKGTRWFVEGDIKGCFDNLKHPVIMKILRKHIKDQSLLTLIEGMLQAGYMEDWKYYRTYSGTPQGGIVSPLLANIVLNELDEFVEEKLIPMHTQGKERKFNPEYTKLAAQERKERKKGNWTEAKKLRSLYTKLPSRIPNDPNFRRMWYIRYADDFLIGFIGTGREAEDIKKKIGGFLKSIELEMSEEKTLITHARTEKARFLGYEINLMNADDKVSMVKKHGKAGRHTRRALNQQLFFSVPQDVIKAWSEKVEERKAIKARNELFGVSDYDIIAIYEVELQGLINYYNRAHNQEQLKDLRYKWKESLKHTLARKHKTSLSAIKKKYETFYNANGESIVGVSVEREGKKPLVTAFGRKPIQRHRNIIRDEIQEVYIDRNGLIDRLLAETCELCGKEGLPVEGHHVRKLKDLKKGKEKPEWVRKMIEIKRKTLFVCKECHQKIHDGKYDGKRLTQI